MNEAGISPLAKRLAEENNVNWRGLQGSGPDGRVVERDVLDFLAKVMAGEEEVDPTPEPLPEGLEAWPEPGGVASMPAADDVASLNGGGSAESGALYGSSDASSGAGGELGGGAAAHDDDEGILDEDAFEPSFDAQDGDDEDEPAISEDVFLFEEEDESGVALASEASSVTPAEEQVAHDDDESLLWTDDEPPSTAPGGADDWSDLSAGESRQHGAGARERQAEGSIADDPGEAFVHNAEHAPGDEQSYEHGGEGEGVAEAVALPDDLPGEGGPEDEHGGARYSAVAEEGAADAAEADDEEQGHVRPSDHVDAGTQAPFAADSAQEHDWTETEPARDAADADPVWPGGAEGPDPKAALAEPGGEQALSEGESRESGEHWLEGEGRETDLADGSRAAEVHSADAPEGPSVDEGHVAGQVAEGVPGATAASHEEIGLANEAAALVAGESLPLVSYGMLLRRHVELSPLTEAQRAAAKALGQSEPVQLAPFLLRAVAKAVREAGEPEGRIGLAVLSKDGVAVAPIDGAADIPFAELVRIAAEAGGRAEPRDQSEAALVVADMSSYQVDEAVLNLGAPVVTLGRLLFDSTEGRCRSTVSLSGELSPEVGAMIVSRVAELLDSPVQLVM